MVAARATAAQAAAARATGARAVAVRVAAGGVERRVEGLFMVEPVGPS